MELWQHEMEWELRWEYQRRVNDLHAQWAEEQTPPNCGYIYVIEMYPTDDPFAYAPDEMLKIGRARNPASRFKTIQRTAVKMPYRLKMHHCWWAEDAPATERLLHTMFTRFRVDGEWFRIPHEYTNVFHEIWYFEGTPDSREGIITYHDYDQVYSPVIEFFQDSMKKHEEWRKEREGQSCHG